MSSFCVTVEGYEDYRHVRLAVDGYEFYVEAAHSEVDDPDADGRCLGAAMLSLTKWAADVERERCAKQIECLWVNGIPSQEFAHWIRKGPEDE